MTEHDHPIRYPNVTVALTGQDGNAFSILGRVTQALRRAGVPKSEIEEYHADAMSGDYNHLLATTWSWVTVY